MKTIKGVFYFTSRSDAEKWAKQNGWPTNFIRYYGKGHAVQAFNSGKYAGPDQTFYLGHGWRPIAEADKSIAHEQHFPSVDMTLRNSERYWVRDADGRVYEASWSEGNNGRDFWWDWEGESPADPVEFMPHPLSRSTENLIQAAPDLLEALKQCRDAMHEDNAADGWLEVITSAEEAIAKAEGR